MVLLQDMTPRSPSSRKPPPTIPPSTPSEPGITQAALDAAVAKAKAEALEQAKADALANAEAKFHEVGPVDMLVMSHEF